MEWPSFASHQKVEIGLALAINSRRREPPQHSFDIAVTIAIGADVYTPMSVSPGVLRTTCNLGSASAEVLVPFVLFHHAGCKVTALIRSLNEIAERVGESNVTPAATG